MNSGDVGFRLATTRSLRYNTVIVTTVEYTSRSIENCKNVLAFKLQVGGKVQV